MNARSAHRMMPADEARLAARRHLGPRVERQRGAADPGIDGPDDVGEVEPGPDVKLRREPDLHVSHALGLAVLAQLEGRAFERLPVLQHGDGVPEPLRYSERFA